VRQRRQECVSRRSKPDGVCSDGTSWQDGHQRRHSKHDLLRCLAVVAADEIGGMPVSAGTHRLSAARKSNRNVTQTSSRRASDRSSTADGQTPSLSVWNGPTADVTAHARHARGLQGRMVVRPHCQFHRPQASSDRIPKET
jgi:hypothetical protein